MYIYTWSHMYTDESIILQVIKNIRNVTRHRNGQSVNSRQTRWEWQLLSDEEVSGCHCSENRESLSG